MGGCSGMPSASRRACVVWRRSDASKWSVVSARSRARSAACSGRGVGGFCCTAATAIGLFAPWGSGAEGELPDDTCRRGVGRRGGAPELGLMYAVVLAAAAPPAVEGKATPAGTEAPVAEEGLGVAGGMLAAAADDAATAAFRGAPKPPEAEPATDDAVGVSW